MTPEAVHVLVLVLIGQVCAFLVSQAIRVSLVERRRLGPAFREWWSDLQGACSRSTRAFFSGSAIRRLLRSKRGSDLE